MRAGAANLTGKPRLKSGQADITRASIAADRGPMAAMIIAAVDQETSDAGGAHLGKGDFPRTVEHTHMIAPIAGEVKPLGLVPQSPGRLVLVIDG
jgi:hypothetical protein